MPVETCTLTGNLSDLVGVRIPGRQAVAVLETNQAPGESLVLTDPKGVRLGVTALTLTADGSFTQAGVVTTDSPDVMPEQNRQYRLRVFYPDPRAGDGQGTWDSGWFFLTGDADLADRVVVSYLPPTAVGEAVALLDEKVDAAETTMQTYVAQAQAARDDVEDVRIDATAALGAADVATGAAETATGAAQSAATHAGQVADAVAVAGGAASAAEQAATTATGAADTATSAAAAAELDRDTTAAHRAAVEAVPATNDGIMTAVASDQESDFASTLTASTGGKTRLVSRAIADGSDQSATLNSEAAVAASSGRVLELPAGEIVMATPWTVPTGATVVASPGGTTIKYTGSGTLLLLASKLFVQLDGINLWATHATARVLDLSNSFRCKFFGVTIRGNHTTGTGATYAAQVGLTLRDNAGDNRFVACDFNNLGVGVSTDTIQNYFLGCNIGTCLKPFEGGDPTGVNFRAGVSWTGGTIVGTSGVTDTAINITGSSAEWWFSQIHVEKCDKAVVIGNENGGPRAFSLRDAFVSSQTKTIEIKGARQTVLDNITFRPGEGGATPIDLVIDPAAAADGYAVGLRPSTAFDFADSVFPAGWAVLGNRSSAGRVPRLRQAESWQAFIPVSAPTNGNANFEGAARFDAGYPMSMQRSSVGGVQNAEVSWRVDLSAGTWTVQLAHVRGTNRGIYTVQLDGVTIGTVDGYFNGVDVRFDSITGVAVPVGGVHTVRLLMATKNAAASSYYGTPSFLQFTRTA
ncbi:hypothetical protein [Nocardioides sp. Arc9.136]|uniref:hypothetical protein n=1 Tax=Nocardioides sp. Arc9.136 TaxID=2996826 RepID=UPI002666CF83|nr:hypothetical protein [Nocardioides sp. Arc9.136]WKN47157.1 hypothetical protein OSR43_14025 [Nocardioides sp. Arc9.136]